MNTILSHKGKNVYLDEVRAMNEIEVNLFQEKIEFINDAYQKELHYWKKGVSGSVLIENGRKHLRALVPPRIFLARKAAIKNVKNVHEIISNLKSQYLLHNEQQRTFIQDIPIQEDIPSFEAITDYLKNFSKSIKEVEKMRLKNKTLLGGWMSTAAKVFTRDKSMGEKNLSGRFEDWLYKECITKKQTIYNYRNLCMLMSIAPKLMNCWVNMTYFVKNLEILFNYFEENEEQIPCKHNVHCACDVCRLSTFFLILF